MRWWLAPFALLLLLSPLPASAGFFSGGISTASTFTVQSQLKIDNSIAISSITRVSTTATATTLVPHGYSTNDLVWIYGAPSAQNAYNREHLITVTGPTTFTYTVSGSPATPATGTLYVQKETITNTTDGNGVAIGDTYCNKWYPNVAASSTIPAGPNRLSYSPGSSGSNGNYCSDLLLEYSQWDGSGYAVAFVENDSQGSQPRLSAGLSRFGAWRVNLLQAVPCDNGYPYYTPCAFYPESGSYLIGGLMDVDSTSANLATALAIYNTPAAYYGSSYYPALARFYGHVVVHSGTTFEGSMVWTLEDNGHQTVGGANDITNTTSVPAISSGCGTDSTITGSDSLFTVVIGSGSPTSCVVNFAFSWANDKANSVAYVGQVACFLDEDTDLVMWKTSVSATTVTMTSSAALTQNAKLKVRCMGQHG